MNSVSWNYIGANNVISVVRVRHYVERGGHLLISHNENLVLYDFDVVTDAEYTFFIDDELCKVRLKRNGNYFQYYFEVDETTKTPLNILRRAENRKNILQTAAIFAISLCVIAIAVASVKAYFKYSRSQYLFKNGVNTLTTISVYPKQTLNVRYQFEYGGNNVVGWETVPEIEGQVYSPEGIPLKTEEQYLVRFDPKSLSNNRVLWNLPSQAQLDLYFAKIKQDYIQKHPEATPEETICFMNAAYQVRGLKGLSDFYHQDIGILSNPYHNGFTYEYILKKHPRYITELQNCLLR